MPWIIIGAGGLLLVVLTPLVAYLGYRATRRKRVGSGHMWGWYCLMLEILGVTFLLAWAQAYVSDDTAKEILAGVTTAGVFAWVLAGARFGVVFHTVWRDKFENGQAVRHDQ